MANTDKTARAGAGTRTARQPAVNVEEQSELEIISSVREFCKQQGLNIQRVVVESKTDNKFPTVRFQDKTGKGNKALDLEANGVTGVVLSQNASKVYALGDKIDIDSLSVGFGKGLDDQDRYVICTGGVFEDVDDID